jgi:hypothetical protein
MIVKKLLAEFSVRLRTLSPLSKNHQRLSFKASFGAKQYTVLQKKTGPNCTELFMLILVKGVARSGSTHFQTFTVH